MSIPLEKILIMNIGRSGIGYGIFLNKNTKMGFAWQ